MIEGMTYAGTQIPPIADKISIESDPKIDPCGCVDANVPTNTPYPVAAKAQPNATKTIPE